MRICEDLLLFWFEIKDVLSVTIIDFQGWEYASIGQRLCEEVCFGWVLDLETLEHGGFLFLKWNLLDCKVAYFGWVLPMRPIITYLLILYHRISVLVEFLEWRRCSLSTGAMVGESEFLFLITACYTLLYSLIYLISGRRLIFLLIHLLSIVDGLFQIKSVLTILLGHFFDNVE